MKPPSTVVWSKSILRRDVAAYYVRAQQLGQDASAINAAMTRIDRLLERNPLGEGESREDDECVLVVEPLSITFEVHEDEKVVVVIRAHDAPPRHGQ